MKSGFDILRKLSLGCWYSPETGTQSGCEIPGLESFPEVSSIKPQLTWLSIGNTPSWRNSCTRSPELLSNQQYWWWHYEYMKSLYYVLITWDFLAYTTLLERNLLEKASLIPGLSAYQKRQATLYLISSRVGLCLVSQAQLPYLQSGESQVHTHPWTLPLCYNIQYQPQKFSEVRWRQLSNELTVPGTVNLPNSNYQMDIKKSEKLQRTVIKMINEQKALFIQGEKTTAKYMQRIKEKWFIQFHPRYIKRVAKETHSCTRCLSSALQSSHTVHSLSSILSFLSTTILHEKWKLLFINLSPNLDISTVQPIHSSIQ